MSPAERLARRHRRRHRQVLAVDECLITRPVDDVWDEEEGRHLPGEPVEVASGRCNVVIPQASEQVVEVAATPHTLRTLQVELHDDVEVDAGGIMVDDEFTLTRSANPRLLGRSWYVRAISDGTLAPARLMTVSEEQARG